MLKSRAVTQNVIGSIVIENSFLSDNRMSDPFLDQNVKRGGEEKEKKKKKKKQMFHKSPLGVWINSAAENEISDFDRGSSFKGEDGLNGICSH